eukprot:UN09484
MTLQVWGKNTFGQFKTGDTVFLGRFLCQKLPVALSII